MDEKYACIHTANSLFNKPPCNLGNAGGGAQLKSKASRPGSYIYSPICQAGTPGLLTHRLKAGEFWSDMGFNAESEP